MECEYSDCLPAIGSTLWITQPNTKTPYVATVLQHEKDWTEIQWSIAGRNEWVQLHRCQMELIITRPGTKLKKQRKRNVVTPNHPPTPTTTTVMGKTNDNHPSIVSSQMIQERNPSTTQPPFHTNNGNNNNNSNTNHKHDDKKDHLIDSSNNNHKNNATLEDFYYHSAYLQHLAEMCFMISKDVRWKLQDDNNNHHHHPKQQLLLFQWQDGDDVYAIHALEQLYHNQPTSKNKKKKNNARAMHLYARLFHRKGPWFTLDDLFFRYYYHYSNRMPKKIQPKQTSSSTRSRNDNQDPKEESMPFKTKENDCTGVEDDGTNVDKSSSSSSLLLYDSLESMKPIVMDFLGDVQKLLSCGLFRTFASEQECGMVVGNVSKKLLTCKDRANILQKLGGTSPKKKKSLENIIWKQMRTQTSMFSSRNNHSYLPIRHHVHHLLLNKFANRLSTLLTNQTTSSTTTTTTDCKTKQRISTKDISKWIQDMWIECTNQNVTCSQPLEFGMCVTLREKPLQTLRRAIRLILCATSGPGNIRSDLYSGWNLPVYENPVVEETNKHPTFWGTFTPPHMPHWGDAVYRSLHSMLGLIHCDYQDQYQPLLLLLSNDDDDDSSSIPVQIFPNKTNFLQWEVSAEIRLVVDHLIEWNESALYVQRKNIRMAKKNRLNHKNNAKKRTNPLSDECSSDDDDDDDNDDDDLSETTPPIPSINDALKLKSDIGRKLLVQRLMGMASSTLPTTEYVHAVTMDVMLQTIESEIRTLGIFDNDEKTTNNKDDDDEKSKHVFQTDAERMLCIIAIICHQVLVSNLCSISDTEMSLLIHRPWLRHMTWQCIVASIIWDCIQYVEKAGFYDLACFMLHTILLGPANQSNHTSYLDAIGSTNNVVPYLPDMGSKDEFNGRHYVETFVHLFLSRRTRGKAFDRLTIDLNHVWKDWKSITSKTTNTKQTIRDDRIGIQNIYKIINHSVIPRSSIPFSSVQKLTRRLEKTLKCNFLNASNEETEELKLRLIHTNNTTTDDPKTKFWIPATDISVANAIVNEDAYAVGKRCSYVGNEVEKERLDLGSIRSLTVEELAMEEYNAGNLPTDDVEGLNIIKGGWVGWHDEGSHVRVLFRIFLSSILSDDESYQDLIDSKFENEQYTIFLTPYQSAPHDIHVGHSKNIRSFYERRRHKIQALCQKIENMTPQEIIDFVFQTISSRKSIADTISTNVTDRFLESDIQELRTLSMIAAGFGGKMLSDIVRALCFDFRHYSGGIPDLLLVRAYSESSEGDRNFELVDLGSWVGEAFVDGNVKINRGSDPLKSLTDDEFLGCNSEDFVKKRKTRSTPYKNQDTTQDLDKTSSELPSRLSLIYQNRLVSVECMFVEVKSSNDRLDERQGDWLNILDLHGHARVCKFEASSKRKKT